jgi:hypothetical protein
MPRLVLSIDPGRAKHGVAIIEADAMRVVYRCVIEATSLTGTVNGLLTRFPSIAVIVMGDGTGSKAAVDLVRQVSGSTPMAVVNEACSGALLRRPSCDGMAASAANGTETSRRALRRLRGNCPGGRLLKWSKCPRKSTKIVLQFS